MIKLDESLSLKLSKSALINVEQEFCEKFVTHEYRRIIDRDFEDIQKRFEKHQNRFNEELKDYTDKIYKLVNETMEAQLQKKLDQYDKVTANFKQFFDQDDLGALIDRKADIELFKRV